MSDYRKSQTLSSLTTNPILTGAAILTLAGFASRIIGFFYRIFLSQQIGAEGMGVYQLIFPVFSVCFSLCCGPVQTAISRYVAAQNTAPHGSSHNIPGQKPSSPLSSTVSGSPESVLRVGLILSFSLACLCAAAVYIGSEFLAEHILMEARCGTLLRVMALTIPICSIHCCISGYYYGLQKAHIPAFAQLAEQIVRVVTVYGICASLTEAGQEPTASTAVWGMVCGELASLAFTVLSYLYHRCHHSHKNQQNQNKYSHVEYSPHASSHVSSTSTQKHPQSHHLPQLLSLAVPLTATRLCVSVLQSGEAVMIPSRLQLYGMDAAQALSVYGVLTGMAYPFILFPSAVIQSMAVMLLPDMAHSQSMGNQERIDINTTRTITVSLYLGILCTGLFLFYGDAMGETLFSSTLAGSYIVTLSWLCPFLYLSTTLGSILNGLGQTKATFSHSIRSLLAQLCFVLFLVPVIGIRGYLYGLLFGQLFLTLLHLHSVCKMVHIHYQAIHHLLRPMGALGLAAFFSKKITEILLTPVISQPIILLCLSCTLLAGIYGCFLLASRNHL